jgi:hypothetical protein
MVAASQVEISFKQLKTIDFSMKCRVRGSMVPKSNASQKTIADTL